MRFSFFRAVLAVVCVVCLATAAVQGQSTPAAVEKIAVLKERALNELTSSAAPKCDAVKGTCMDKAQCTGKSLSGLCPGAANIQCCVKAATNTAAAPAAAPAANTNSNSRPANAVASCTANGVAGWCQDKTTCTGNSHSGLCPGAANIQCCTPKSTSAASSSTVLPNRSSAGTSCKAFGRVGVCMETVKCVGSSAPVPGFCPGAANIQCCVVGAPKPKKTPGVYKASKPRRITQPAAARNTEAEHKKKFEEFRVRFGKTYPNAAAKEAAYQIFKKNRERIIKLNDKHGKGKAVFSSVSPFADVDPADFKKRMSALREDINWQAAFVEGASEVFTPSTSELEQAQAEVNPEHSLMEVAQLPPAEIQESGATVTGRLSVDYRNIITGIKSQMDCGSCYAQAAISAIESQYIRKTGKKVELSPQHLVDCTIASRMADPALANNGCVGGWTRRVFEYLKTTGTCTAAEYPYNAWVNDCKFPKGCAGPKTSGFTPGSVCIPAHRPACNVDAYQGVLLAALKKLGPMVANVDASNWQGYTGSIFPSSACSSDWNAMNHVVQVVGYGEENGTKFWLVRNSYSSRWGEEGYIRIEASNGSCGLPNIALMPNLA